MATTRGKLLTRIRTKLGDTNASEQVWSDAELRGYLQDGYDLFCRSTLALFDRVYIPDVVGEAVYDIPETTVNLDRVTWNNERIMSLPQSEFIGPDQNFETQMGPVFAYLADGDGAFRIRKIRVPVEDQPTKFLIEVFRLGIALADDSDALEITDWDCRTLIFYVLGQAYQREGPGQSKSAFKHFMARWIEGLKRVQERNKRVQARRVISIGDGGEDIRPARIPRPQLPWNFGTPVRVARRGRR